MSKRVAKRPSTKTKTKTHEIDVPGTLDGLIQLVTEFRTFATSAGVSAPVQRDMHAAIDELVSNIILHGYGDDESGHRITAHVTCSKSALDVEIVDDSRAFDPLNEQPSRDEHGLQIGGFGIRLARHWVDEIRYTRRDDRNHLQLTKRRT
ncbi:MAG: ATP-binding protein [Vicinamibacterales bacterium]